MADNCEIAIGPYLKHLCDSSTCNVPRTTKYRWSKKAKLVSEREESYPEERNLHQATIEIEGSLPGFLAPIKLNGTLI